MGNRYVNVKSFAYKNIKALEIQTHIQSVANVTC